MNDQDVEFAVVMGRSSTVWIVLMSTMMIPLSVLLVAPVFGESGQAVATVGLILVEALVLYVGYGALTRIASPIARELLVGA